MCLLPLPRLSCLSNSTSHFLAVWFSDWAKSPLDLSDLFLKALPKEGVGVSLSSPFLHTSLSFSALSCCSPRSIYWLTTVASLPPLVEKTHTYCKCMLTFSFNHTNSVCWTKNSSGQKPKAGTKNRVVVCCGTETKVTTNSPLATQITGKALPLFPSPYIHPSFPSSLIVQEDWPGQPTSGSLH